MAKTIQIFHKTEAGKGIEFADGKYNVKSAMPEVVTVTDEGVGVAKLPKVLVVEGNAVKITYTDGTSENLDLPAQSIDVKLQGAEVEGNNLKLTLTDGTEIVTDLTKFMDFTPEGVLEAIKNFDTAQKAEFKTALLELLKGTEVQDSNGTTEGFLLPTA